MGRLSLLDHPQDERGHAFLIIAGIGFDALMIDDTDPQLKKNISWLAYFVSGFRHLFSPKYRGTVTMTGTDGEIHSSPTVAFRTFLAGNCGQIPMVSLMPEATYDDGLLDFELIDTSGGIIGWANLFGDVVHQTMTGKPSQSPLSTNSTLDQIQGVSAEITLERKALAQVDGDIVGETKHLRFDVDHRSLRVRVPQLDGPDAGGGTGASSENTGPSPQQ
jgi:diacylglycerol kinase family enzyme